MQNELSASEQKKAGLRDELLHTQRDKLDAETEKSGALILT